MAAAALNAAMAMLRDAATKTTGDRRLLDATSDYNESILDQRPKQPAPQS